MSARVDAAAVPRPIGVGPEMAALSRFYRDVTWKGIIQAGGMGPGTPAMTGVGRGKVQAIQDGRWIVLDCEQDQFLLDGTPVLTWQLHWVSGWAPEHGEYRAVMTDNYGHANVYRGRIEGDLRVRVPGGSRGQAALHLGCPTRASLPGATKWRWVMDLGSSSRNTPWCRNSAAAHMGRAGPGDREYTAPWVRNAGRMLRLSSGSPSRKVKAEYLLYQVAIFHGHL